jgi:sulfatase modifying factor 1
MPSTDGMVLTPSGRFRMGSADFYPEEQPVREIEVDGFWIDEHPVTVAQFRRGGLDQATFCWGDEFMPSCKLMTKTWHGEFPFQHDRPDQWLRTSPVRTYPPNGYGLYDMAGNVWEWTDDFFSIANGDAATHPCCAPRNPRTPEPVAASYRLDEPGGGIPRRVTKGGSHLCAPNYCLRYRPAARQGEAIDTSTGHIGFRCVVRQAS